MWIYHILFVHLTANEFEVILGIMNDVMNSDIHIFEIRLLWHKLYFYIMLSQMLFSFFWVYS